MSEIDEKTTEIMEEARKQGWVPEDEWKGDPDKWRPAEEFVERGKNIIPILNDRLAKTEQMIETLVKTQKAELKRVKEEQGKAAALSGFILKALALKES